MGLGVGRMVIAPALDWAGFGAAGTVLSLVAGLMIAAWMVTTRRSTAARVQRERWVADTVAVRRSALEQRIVTDLGAAEAAIGREVWNRTRSACV